MLIAGAEGVWGVDLGRNDNVNEHNDSLRRIFFLDALEGIIEEYGTLLKALASGSEHEARSRCVSYNIYFLGRWLSIVWLSLADNHLTWAIICPNSSTVVVT